MEIKKCKYCGKEFKVRDKRMLYCSSECKDTASHIRNQTRDEDKKWWGHTPTNKNLICHRTECMFSKPVGNGCKILSEVYEDDEWCSFFKEK